jgi:hypothetical protein
VPRATLVDRASPASTLATTLRAYGFGTYDPTTRLVAEGGRGEFWRATLTPHGPATLRLRWAGDAFDHDCWGPGGSWLAATVPALVGSGDPGHRFEGAHPTIMAAQRDHPDVRLGASGTLYHELLPTVIAQRVTSGQAIRAWYAVVRRLGTPAPGPHRELLLPPHPDRLAGLPGWWFHPLDIEAKRAEALRALGRHAGHLWEWSDLGPVACAAKLSLLRGIGRWTIGSALGPALGDPDAVPVGDFHLKHAVCFALAGEPRGTDERMLELLAPYHGQRGRVIRLLGLARHRYPARGPRRRVLPMARW